MKTAKKPGRAKARNLAETHSVPKPDHSFCEATADDIAQASACLFVQTHWPDLPVAE